MKQAMVTGANGFIGQHIVKRLLSQGIKVHVLVRRQKIQFSDGVFVFEGDISDSDAVKKAVVGVDTIIHLAGKAHDFSGKDNVKDYFNVNVEGTRNVLDCCNGSEVKHFIYFSSVKAMVEESKDVLDESFIPAPTTPYGESKLAAERLVADYGIKSGIRTASLRLPAVYGPGNKGNIYTLIEAIDRGRFVMVGRGDNKRSMVYVGNVVDAALAVIERDKTKGAIYIVTDGIDYTVKELYEVIAKGLGKRPLPFYIPQPIANILGWAGSIGGRIIGKPLQFNSEVLDKFTNELTFSSRKIQEEIGFKPKYNLYNTIGETIEWYKGCR
ncbi:MAG: SDR family NAD(P)-dependent oxidoreductase [Candidatus Methanoperedens sp.]|nr:SDR family NAD(P)-dependent oxidoreductase [Candidatus Methanoperedens sp.]